MRKGKFISAIIAAAGQGKRMRSSINKQYLILNQYPILVHTLYIFEKIVDIDEIILLIHPDEIDYCKENIVKKYGFSKVKVVPGGRERQESIYNGLKALNLQCDMVVVHDGARPFVRKEDITKTIDEAILYGAVGLGVPVKDTIKVVGKDKIIQDTPDRKSLWAIHTPQTFEYQLLIRAHEMAIKDGFLGTDDTVLVERIGYPVRITMGSYDNIKITTPEDLYIGEAILKNREAKGCE